jgi:hypothetical protein
MDLDPMIFTKEADVSVGGAASQPGHRSGGVIEQLRSLVDVAPPDATVPVRWIAELLDEDDRSVELAVREKGSYPIMPDLTVGDIMAATQRERPTIIGWIRGGGFPGAYKLNGREWRIPAGDWSAFLERKRNGGQANHSATMPRSVDLGRWRAHVVRKKKHRSSTRPD